MKDIKSYQFFKKLTDISCVKKIILFGSRARGDNQDRADIDLAIYCPNATDNEWLKILNIMDDADTLLQIDCIRLDTLEKLSALNQAILQQGVKLYDKSQD